MRTGKSSDPWWLSGQIQNFVLGLMAALFVVLIIQAFRMAYRPGGYDFTSYLLAAEAIWDGKNPYVIAMPFPYVYPLLLAFILIPLTFVPYWLANAVWLLCSVAGLVVGCAVLQRTASDECGTTWGRHLAVPALAALLIFFPPVLSTTIAGQANSIVLFCCAMFYYYYAQKRPRLAGMWLAAAISIKVLPAFLLVFLAVRNQFRIMYWTCVFGVLFLLAPAIVAGKKLVEYHETYLRAFLIPSMSEPAAHSTTHFSLQGAIGNVLPSVPAGWIKIGCLAGVALALLAVEMAAARSDRPRRDVWPFCAYLVGVLLLSPLVEIHHLVLAAPAVFLLCVKAFFDRSWATPAVIVLVGAFVVCFDIVAKLDRTTICYFICLAILLVLLFLAAGERNAVRK